MLITLKKKKKTQHIFWVFQHWFIFSSLQFNVNKWLVYKFVFEFQTSEKYLGDNISKPCSLKNYGLCMK